MEQPRSFEQILAAVAGSSPINGLTYRNSALLVLMNIPLFINFLRDHKRVQTSTSCEIQNCLTCALRDLALHYWTISTGSTQLIECRAFVDTLVKLWRMCRMTFWGNSKDPKQKIGPEDDTTEYPSDVFLTHLLQEIERQLMVNER